MSRLASFRGPSTPSTSPVQHKSPHPPSSPSRTAESTYHRKIRTLLQELRATTQTWDDIVLIDGLKSAKGLVDARTDLDNAIALIPDRIPRSHLVGPKLALMEERIVELDLVLSKLQKQFRRMNAIIENMDNTLNEAHKVKGWQWVHAEPLWVTWPLEKFVSSMHSILIPYHRSLHSHTELVNILRSHAVSFEASREVIAQWVEQRWLEEDGWEAKWEDLCSVEVERWNK